MGVCWLLLTLKGEEKSISKDDFSRYFLFERGIEILDHVELYELSIVAVDLILEADV